MINTLELLQAQILELEKQVLGLEDRHNKLKELFKNAGVGIWDWSVQTGEATFNEHWADIIGYKLEELSPLSIETWKKYAHPDDLKKSESLLIDYWAGNTQYYAFP